MANNAYLINSVIHSSDIVEILERGEAYEVLSTAGNQIPVIWYFCFEASDLIANQYHCVDDDESPFVLNYMAPCTTKERAQANLFASKSLVIEFCGDEKLGEQYWEKAVADLQDMPYPYLSLHPIEVLFLNDPDVEAATFAKGFSRSRDSFDAMAELAFYDSSLPPVSLVELYRNPYLDRLRARNASALDMGVKGIDSFGWAQSPDAKGPDTTSAADNADKAPPPAISQHQTDAAITKPSKPWWKFW
ncbi:hypothetical protein KJI95_04415 [Shewanella sp. JM162201]|uniref:DUF4274 domain-containing protein n=1 Tax=Shewanella jiangmenensis TaxID=2837387 RepID=A0ABS5V006_9GAMM|nr:hypothetical protein [Shewanella jiangmenensis]MBT1443770.1 hypothetical protein [Shewanella jiangmenensis]